MIVTIGPVVIGAFGKTLNLLPRKLKNIGIENCIVDRKRSAMQYFARILKKILEI